MKVLAADEYKFEEQSLTICNASLNISFKKFAQLGDVDDLVNLQMSEQVIHKIIEDEVNSIVNSLTSIRPYEEWTEQDINRF